MEVVGIVVEYNPFHNGHKYHLDEIKKKHPDCLIVAVMGTYFSQRGEASIISKWDKTKIALEMGIDLVIELPTIFNIQSADKFCMASIKILNYLKVNHIIFGSESNDINTLEKIALKQINDPSYNETVKQALKEGISYPMALNKALGDDLILNKPNDILALGYIREILKNNYSITYSAIKRTNDYHDTKSSFDIISATNIRKRLIKNENISSYVPKEVLNVKIHINNDYFPYLKYQIINNIEDLNKFLSVDEGLEHKIKKAILKTNSIEEFIIFLKSKRYTYNKLSRLACHILTGITKEMAQEIDDITYLRVLGFNKCGQDYLKIIKKDLEIPLIVNANKYNFISLEFEKKIAAIYDLITNSNNYLSLEYISKPIIIDNKKK